VIWVLYWVDPIVRSSKSHSTFVVGCLTILYAATIGSAGGTWSTLPDNLRIWDTKWLYSNLSSYSDLRPAGLCNVISGIVLQLTADALVVKSINLEIMEKMKMKTFLKTWRCYHVCGGNVWRVWYTIILFTIDFGEPIFFYINHVRYQLTIHTISFRNGPSGMVDFKILQIWVHDDRNGQTE